MSIAGCSMVARMPRYSPASPGIRRTPRIPVSGRNGSSRHVLALLDSSSRRISEQNSGLLIRGFGVQVPGGAHVVTWGFATSGHFLCARFVPVAAPWLLARTDPAIRVLSKTARPASDPGGHAARFAPLRPAADTFLTARPMISHEIQPCVKARVPPDPAKPASYPEHALQSRVLPGLDATILPLGPQYL